MSASSYAHLEPAARWRSSARAWQGPALPQCAGAAPLHRGLPGAAGHAGQPRPEPDKAGELRPEFLASVPLQDSFCQFVLRDGGFRTECSAQDARLDGRYQGVMGAYGDCRWWTTTAACSTLCHFDTDERTLPDEEFAFLQKGGAPDVGGGDAAVAAPALSVRAFVQPPARPPVDAQWRAGLGKGRLRKRGPARRSARASRPPC